MIYGGYHYGMATNISQDDFQKTALRLPKDLHARLHEAAAREGRSYNAEIITRLQETFEVRNPSEHVSVVLASLENTMAKNAFEHWQLRAQMHDLGHVVLHLLKMLDTGSKPTEEQAKKITDMATAACQGPEFQENPLRDIQDRLDETSKTLKEATRVLMFNVVPTMAQMTVKNDRDAPIEVTIRGKKKILERGPDGLVERPAKPAK